MKNYHYIKDYQGNNVAVQTSSVTLTQTTDYYPYGEPWREPSGQPWLFGGNERLRIDGINEYDFNARRYNSVTGSFTTWDPLCEKRPWESPYVFCGGDPVNYSDPSGLEWVSKSENGNKYWRWNENITSLESARDAGYDGYLASGSIVDNARIGDGGLGSVYLGHSASDVCYTYSNKDVTPFQVGIEWLTGKGPRDRVFQDGDYFTELLRQHSHYKNAINLVEHSARLGIYEGIYNYELSGIEGIGKYLIDYSTLSTFGLTGNLAVTYLGSYRLSWKSVISSNSLKINFTIRNSSTMQSASRPPFIGYLPIWQNTIGNRINTYFNSGWGSKTTQTFYMSEIIPFNK